MILTFNRMGLLTICLFFAINLLSRDICLGQTPKDNKTHNFINIYVLKTITNAKIIPDTALHSLPAKEISITACRDEFEPATFVISAVQKILKLEVAATDLQGEQSLILASAVDVRIIKSWFQSGVTNNETNKVILTPELLLKDEKLVRVDIVKKKNYLRIRDVIGKESYVLISGKDSKNLRNIQPRDADTLQPVDIDAGMNKQFWITLRIPENAVPGLYQGKIKLTAANTPPAEIDLRVRVLPFTLEKPRLRGAIFYRGKLTRHTSEYPAKMGDAFPAINADWKTPQQYQAEIQDMKDHGIEYPTIYQKDEQLLRKELEIRKKVGLPKDALYSCGVVTGNPTTPEKLEALKTEVKKLIKIAREFGYEDIYVYGIDVAEGERLKSQRAAWNAVHEIGGKVFAAVAWKGSFELVGDALDLAVVGARPDPRQAKQYHEVGHQIFGRGNPQCGVEEPETYRRNFGLLLWKAGYDGAMNYAYQANYGGHIWNDFDVPDVRNQVFAYPTSNGVVDTIEWEGQREGIDDLRYLATLLKAIKEAKPNKGQLASAAQKWVEGIDPRGDLDALRTQMIDWILQLQ